VAFAGEQTAGRGRSGHDWESPPNVSVATSIALFPTGVPIERIPRLTIIAAIAVAEAIEELYPLKTSIKWPNDILINDKKICGILTERHPELADPQKGVPVIVGIGVNVHHDSFPGELSDKAISIDMALREVGEKITTHRKDICVSIWNRFDALYRVFTEGKGSLASFLDEYNLRLINRNKKVKVLDPNGEYEGVALNIDEEGRLLVEVGNEIRKIDSGEVSVRGIYGYV
ncbi:MAG: biotin--[acetyl-CoA-carboxylase] ligase, partial [Lachnospiraceae bacterium]|nr:biotin--[acetyl-CoA-carboxylase] ligase [Lachnospiraceae bacterium]